MGISTRRVRLFATSLTLAAVALGVVGIVLFGVGVRGVAAAPSAVHVDGPHGAGSRGRGTAPVGLSGQQRSSSDAAVSLGAAADEGPIDGDVGVQQAPDLAVSKIDGVARVVPGDTLTYTITIVNTGNQSASGVVVTDTLPVSTTFLGPPGWGQVGSTQQYSYTFDGSLGQNDDPWTVTLTVALTDALPASLAFITNSVEVTGQGPSGSPSSASGTDVDAVAGPRELAISKTDGVSSVEPGETLTYTITVTNTGYEDLTGVVVTDTVPLSTMYQDGTSGWGQAGSSRTYAYAIGPLDAGYTATLTLTVTFTDTVPAGLEVITNTVEAADDGSGASPAYARDTDVDAVDAAPILAISKTDTVTEVVPGQALTYTITITNTGDQDAAGVVVTDALPASTMQTGGTDGWQPAGAANVYTFTVGDLGAKHTETLTLTAALTDGVAADLVLITNTVEAADDGEAYDTAVDVDGVSAAPGLAIDKSDGGDSVAPGDTITYTVAVTNTGDREATGVVVTDTLPTLATFEGGTIGWQPVAGSTDKYTYTLGSLAAKDVRVLTLTVALPDTVPAGLESITNTVQVADDGEAGAADTDVDAVIAAPDLAISKTDVVTEAVPGQVLSYTITITNAGDQDATGVVVTDTGHELASFEGGTAGWQPVDSTNAYTYPVGALGAGFTKTLTLALALTDTVPAGLEAITNTVEVSDDGQASASDTDVDEVVAAPDLVISKSDGVTTVQPGQTVTYTLVVTNAGNQDATGVLITDTLPADDYSDFVDVSHGGIPVLPSGIVLWVPFDLPAGDSVSETVTIAVKDLDPWPAGVEVITNTAEVADDGSNGADLNPDDNKADDVDAVSASPDLFISKDDGTWWAAPGQPLVYKLSYLNNGTQDAAGVVISETMPDYVTFNAGASTAGWQPVGTTGVYTLSLGPVAVGTGGAVDFAVTVFDVLPAGVDSISNTVQIDDDGASGADLTPGDNSDQDEDTVLAAPDLAVAKDDGQDIAEPGQLLTYTLTVENVGTQGATGVVVSDSLPADVLFVTASHEANVSGPLVTWPPFELGGGEQVTRTITIQVPSQVPPGLDVITNTASVVDDGANGEDADTENNTGLDVDAVEAVPVLALIKTDGRTAVKPGGVLTYTLTVKNVGRQDAHALVISDTLPAHTLFIAASDGGVKLDGVVAWTGIALPVGAQLERTVTVQVNQSLPPGVTTITNRAEVAGPEGVYDSAQDVDSLVPVPDLILTKDDGAESVLAGEVVTYTLTIANGGSADATGIVLSDTLPAPTAFITASHGATRSGGVVTWPTFALTAGDSVSRTVTVRVPEAVPAAVEAITNTASVQDDGTYGPDLHPGDNRAQDVDLVDADPILAIAKSDGRDTVGPGEVLTYTLTVTNVGTQDATGVVVTDTLPEHTGFVAASAGFTFSPADRTVAWPASVLGVDEVLTRTVTVQVDEALPSGVDSFANTVVVVADGDLSASAGDVDTVVSAPDLRVLKTDGRTGVRPGEIVTYTLTVENVGTQGATGVVLSDTLPANTSYTGASSGGSEEDGVVTWPDFTLAVGSLVTRTVTVGVDDPWPVAATAVLTNTASAADDGANGEDPVPGDNTAIDITRVWPHAVYLPLISRE